MAAQLSAGQHFKFQQVQIIKNESLGIGSYGAVYRAKLDKLSCAAKLLHPILFHDKDPGSRRIQEQFEQECNFLSGIRHPNIVHYLGTCIDTDSGLPVLLMELMDESLTHLLEQSRQPLPFHQEVNIYHDTALALDYLHSNAIIHRDLSSNNVLIAGSRAKVTDFGMSKALEANPRMTPFTQCPGTAVYMPPEGLRIPPVYGAKLDCFSFGVLGIQIMTRQFPDPGPEEQIVEDARSPTGTTKMPILDPERRKNHIDLITPNHPLLPLAIRCLSYRDSDRPSAQELCDQLETLKGGPQYRHSQAPGQDWLTAQVCQAEEPHQQQLQNKDAVIAAGQEREQQLQQELREQMEEKIHCQQELQQHIREKDRSIREKDDLIKAQDGSIREKERQIQELNHQLQLNEAVVADVQQALLQREKEIEQLREDISTMNRERALERVPEQHQIASATPVDTIKLKWKTGPKAPARMVRGSSAVSNDGSEVYIRYETNLYEYNTKGRHWSILPQCPYDYAGLVVMEELLTAVGGCQVKGYGLIQMRTGDLFTLTCEKGEQPWTKIYPPMPTKHLSPAVVYSGNSLIVAGGHGDGTAVAVEVMDTSSRQWFTASSLPHYFTTASATLCGDSLYLMGGYDRYGTTNGSLSVLSCSFTALLESCLSQSLSARAKTVLTAKQPQVWKKAADAPVYSTSCTTLCGRVIAIGGDRKGSGRDRNPTDHVYQYNPAKNAWTIISHMPTPRYQCLVAALPDNSIVVVGGKDQGGVLCDIVEVGSVE